MTRTVLILILLTLSGCSLSTLREPAVTLPTAASTAPSVIHGGNVPTATAAASTRTPASSPTAPVEPSASAAPDGEVTPAAPLPLPDPALFDVRWDQREDFAPGLVSGAQGVLTDFDPYATIYHLQLKVETGYRTMRGREEVHYTNREGVPLNDIVFRLYPNLLGGSVAVSDLLVNGAEVSPKLELDDTVLRVPLSAPLEPGESVVVSMAFVVEIPDNPEGNYGSFTYLDGTLALAHAYPMIAEYTAEEGGWEAEIPAESGDIIYASSSFYRVELTAPGGATIVASGRPDETFITVGDDTPEATGIEWQTWVYRAGPVRDFYIAMSEDYTMSETTVGETTVRSYTYSDEGIGESVLEQTVASVEVFNALIGPYPFTELEIAETPNLALGIEYPGVVVLTNRLYDPEAQSGGGNVGAVRESTVAHEVGHQWFYSTVGNDQLDEPWLDESLAQYVTYRYFAERYGDGAAQGFFGSLEGRWSGVGERPIPVGLPVGDYTPQEYGAIVYGRGPIFFISLGEDLGLETMNAFLQQYYAAHQFGVATTADLKAALESACGCDLTAQFEEWIY